MEKASPSEAKIGANEPAVSIDSLEGNFKETTLTVK
jgi:hypothetical protein